MYSTINTVYLSKEGGAVRTPMDEATFLEFYKNTMLCGSNNFQHFVCK
jgi:hypothetical protein